MIEVEPWMYHSHISIYLDCGLVLPLECIRAVEAEYRAGRVPLNSIQSQAEESSELRLRMSLRNCRGHMSRLFFPDTTSITQNYAATLARAL